ncbi:putative ribonuclease H protein, partial [Mucuna pruriens]
MMRLFGQSPQIENSLPRKHDPSFKIIWKLRVPKCVWFHVWKVCKNILVMNKQRLKRHIAQLTKCPVCVERSESTIHLMQDCIKVRNAWCRLLGGRYPSRFFLDNVMKWVHMNLKPSEHLLILYGKTRIIWYSKVNSYETRRTNNGKTTCGRMIHDHSFIYMLGYSTHIDSYSIILAKLWDSKKRLTLAHARGLTNICIELDSQEILNLIID